MSKKLFVINLLSGRERNRQRLIQQIKQSFNDDIFIIQSKNQFAECLEIIKSYENIIVNGGDGTINSFLPIIIEQNKTLGILPTGSGNGLARTLKIPLNASASLEIIKQNNVNKIDAGVVKLCFKNKIETHYFLSAVGFGIDAAIAEEFEKQSTRGFWGYIKVTLKKIFSHQSVNLKLHLNQQTIEGDFLILSVLNIPQYGNEFYISPSAKIDDGLLNVAMLKKINLLMYPYVLYNLLMKKERRPMIYFKTNRIEIDLNENNKSYHIDGEPRLLSNAEKVIIEVIPSAVNVFVRNN